MQRAKHEGSGEGGGRRGGGRIEGGGGFFRWGDDIGRRYSTLRAKMTKSADCISSILFI